MPKTKITFRNVEAASSEGKDTFLWDSDLRGFGLKVTKAGTKSYVVQYRMGGRETATRRYTIGKHGTWTPATARVEAERILRQAATGTDPQTASKDQQRIERELGFAVFAQRFLEDYGKRHWRPRTYASAASNMNRWVVPVLGHKSLPAITRRDLTAIFDGLPPGSPALPRNIFALVRKLFAWAEERGELERSPMTSMKSPKPVASRDRVLTPEELRWVVVLAGDLGPPFGQFVRMLIVTGQRRDEVAGMAWSELDRGKAMWTLPRARTKNNEMHTVPLNKIAVRELDLLADGESWPRKGLVFTTNGRTPISGYSRMKSRLDSWLTRANQGEAINPWRLHDLRRTFATSMQPLGVRFEVTEALLNHISGSKGGVAGVYQRHDWSHEKAVAMEQWADRLIDLISVPSIGAK